MGYQTLHHPSITIVGGGFAGAALALQLLRRAEGPLRLTVVEPRATLGRGVAYSTPDPVHLVNGPSSLFSLHEDDPDHFTRWTLAHATATGFTPPDDDPGQGFAPRRIFGRYVETELARAVAYAAGRVTFRHLRDEALEVRPAEGGAEVVTRGASLATGVVILATGVFPLRCPWPVEGHPGFARGPWDGGALDRLAATNGDLLVVGTSLSMVDAVASLEARGFGGRILAVSRHGHLIEPRRDRDDFTDFLTGAPLPRTARTLLARVNVERRALLAAGDDWQKLVAALRPHLAALWEGADDAERLRFVRHLRSLWDVSLHVAAPPSFAAVAAALDAGRFTARAARLVALAPEGNRIEAELRRRGARGTEVRVFDGVIDCRGHQEHDWRRVETPLVKSLLAAGTVRPHGTGFGIDATPDGRVVGSDGRARDWLRAIGHPLRGVAWESSSIPEQRAQAAALAERLLAEAKPQARLVG